MSAKCKLQIAKWKAFCLLHFSFCIWHSFLAESLSAAEQPQGSYLCPPGGTAHCLPPGPREVYVPAEGDLIFFTDRSLFWRAVYALAHTGPPYHVGIVVRLPDGHMATLEAAPYTTVHVFLLDALPRLHSHPGAVWVRRL